MQIEAGRYEKTTQRCRNDHEHPDRSERSSKILGASRRATVSSQAEDILNLVEKCGLVGEHLVSTLSRLKPPYRVELWDSFRLALGMIWDQSEIGSLEQILNSFRQQMSMHILASWR
ncbi:hypothetical protein CC78DRAFT_528775 [Lojkania enalia]|uniref:Uncharacterized protein n=1 Tax=Lojkania enalia TaxID=147567 RepID=A0A9P4NBQ3_9PLEO|nr:hypothetical protein CC78DRAFT_528775 [Didymosphaeria enalia]